MNLIRSKVRLKVAGAFNYELFQGEETKSKVVSNLKHQWEEVNEQRGPGPGGHKKLSLK